MTEQNMINAGKQMQHLFNALDCGWTPRTTWATAEIARHAVRLSAIGERECNGVMGPDGFMKWDEDDQKKADFEREGSERAVLDAFAEAMDTETLARLDIEFQGDPRGPSVIVHIQDGPRYVAAFG